MEIPRGNPLFEKKTLSFQDIRNMVENLEQEGFTGYLSVLAEGNPNLIFFSHGAMVRGLEVDNGNVRVYNPGRILNRLKGKEVNTSVYIFSTLIVGVLINFFAFQSVYQDYTVKKKELKKVLDALEKEEYSGLMEISSHDGSSYLVLEAGKIVLDRFAESFGNVICGVAELNRFMESLAQEGVKINVLAEKADLIEDKKKQIEEEMSKVKQLIIKKESGMFSSADQIKVDEYILREWKVKPGIPLRVEMETPDGVVHIMKCAGARKLGGYITIPKPLMKKLKLSEGLPVSIKPLGEPAKEKKKMPSPPGKKN